jgi:hypothetical protein
VLKIILTTDSKILNSKKGIKFAAFFHIISKYSIFIIGKNIQSFFSSKYTGAINKDIYLPK